MLFSKYFEKIVLLNLAERHDRLSFMKHQFKELGEDKVEIHRAVFHPHCDVIIQAFNMTRRGRFTRPNEFNCAREHYSIVKEAFEDGVKSLLIIEDDLCFLKDKNKIEMILKAIPKDYDILRMSGITADPKAKSLLEENERKIWIKHDDVPLWSTAMYALSRRGMQYYLASQDKFYQVADYPLYLSGVNSNIVTSYVSEEPIGIQESLDVLHSDIRQENQHIVNHENFYEAFVNREDYFSFFN